MLLPPGVWGQFLTRNDDQIAMQELLAVPLAYATFGRLLAGAFWLLCVDNQGVLHALLKGRAGADDLNNAVGQVWLDMAEAGIALHVLRVESLANVADGPTRHDLSLLSELGAEFVEPVLPSWVYNLWAWPVRH